MQGGSSLQLQGEIAQFQLIQLATIKPNVNEGINQLSYLYHKSAIDTIQYLFWLG